MGRPVVLPRYLGLCDSLVFSPEFPSLATLLAFLPAFSVSTPKRFQLVVLRLSFIGMNSLEIPPHPWAASIHSASQALPLGSLLMEGLPTARSSLA